MTIFDNYAARYERTREEEYSLSEYLQLCKKDPLTYASAPERMLAAIGEPSWSTPASTAAVAHLRQQGHQDLSGLPRVLRHGGSDRAGRLLLPPRGAGPGRTQADPLPAGPGRRRQVLDRRKAQAPDGAACPSIAIKGSPVNESPLGLFNEDEDGTILEEDYGIPRRYLRTIPSPWAVKRLHEFNGDINKFRVVKRYPSILKQIAMAKTEPGDENNQDISSLVGKVDIRKLEDYAQDDPDAYSYSGGLCLANQGLMEFVEMFKAPIKVLHPLLTATQEGNYKGTEGFGAIPFDGIILAHSNESEWKTFRNNRNNEAFLDRIYIVKVPYCLRVSDEVKIYDKLLRNSSLDKAPCAPGTLRMMAQFAMLSRLKDPENSSIFSKMLVYDGENLKDTDPKAKSLHEYVDYAGVDEGMNGLSTRFAFKILSKVFNFDNTEVAANPVHLLYVLEQQIEREQFPPETEQRYMSYIKEHLAQRYVDFIGKEIQTAYLESYSEYGQNIFDRYVTFADFWIQDQEFRDPDTGESFDRESLNAELEKIEKPAGISNPKDFRNEIVNFGLRARATNGGKNPAWTSYEKVPHRDREEDVLEYRGTAAGDFVQCQGQRRGRHQARRLRGAHGGRRAIRQAGAPAVRVVSARAQVVVMVLGRRRFRAVAPRRLCPPKSVMPTTLMRGALRYGGPRQVPAAAI
jgi:serine protein kinase